MDYRRSNISLFLTFMIIAVFFCLHTSVAPLVGEEARYASVAWQMFVEHNWFIPKRGAAVYLDKSPLLYWLLDLGWWIKINWPWETIFPAAFAILTVLYTQKLAKQLFPDKAELAYLVPIILLAMPFFINHLALLRFDMLLTFFNVLACYYLTRMSVSRWAYWGFVLANGLALLTKGPVIYIFTIPEAILFCIYFSNQPLKDIFKLLSSILLSFSLLLVWWGPIIYQKQTQLIYQLLFEQVIGRTTGKHGPQKPFWDYIILLPCFFLPWMLFSPFLRVRSVFEEKKKDKKTASFLLWSFIICFILFSCIKTKETRYLLPLAPFVAITVSQRLYNILLTYSRQRAFFSMFFIGMLLCLSSMSLFVVLNYFPQKIHIFYAQYFPHSALFIFFVIGFFVILGAWISLKKQILLLIFSSIIFMMTLDLSTTYAISKKYQCSAEKERVCPSFQCFSECRRIK